MDGLNFRFANRRQAGQELADRLLSAALDRPLVFALSRGGVPVAAEIARALAAPLDLMMVGEIAPDGRADSALGAIVDGARVRVIITADVLSMSDADMDLLEHGYAKELAKLKRSKQRLIGDRPRLDPENRVVIVVDDGTASASAVKAALIALRRNGASRLVVALPVAAKNFLEEVIACADEVVCLQQARSGYDAGRYYRDFHHLSDDETLCFLGWDNLCRAPGRTAHRGRGAGAALIRRSDRYDRRAGDPEEPDAPAPNPPEAPQPVDPAKDPATPEIVPLTDPEPSPVHPEIPDQPGVEIPPPQDQNSRRALLLAG